MRGWRQGFRRSSGAAAALAYRAESAKVAPAMLERPDPEPAFSAPFVSSVMRVEPGWIDYNGHLNMAY